MKKRKSSPKNYLCCFRFFRQWRCSLTFTFEDEKREKEVYVMKRDNEKERQRSRELGLAREGLFYREFGTEEMRKKLFPFLPLCRYSFGDIQE